MTGQNGQTGQQVGDGVLALILARFAPPQPPDVPSRPLAGEPEATPKLFPITAEPWDESRALEVQAAVHAQIDSVMAAMPARYPHRQARRNVLANERTIVAGLITKRDPMLWRWPRALEQLLERWSEIDEMTSRNTRKRMISENR